MDHALEHHKTYIGRPASELPSPALVLSLPVMKKNIGRLHDDVEKMGLGFRPHVKTLKSLELTRMMLANGKYRSIVASTIPEIKGSLPLAAEGILDECLYGLPVYPSILPQLTALRSSLRILLLVDHVSQLSKLEKHSSSSQPWDVFIKLDVGSHRAGVAPQSDTLHALVRAAEASPAVNIYGFYCHANHSYAGRTRAEAEETLRIEWDSVISAAKLLPSDRHLVASVGATPTAHVVKSLRADAPGNIKLELHAGNFPCNDLQQVSTGVISMQDQAARVLADVVSVYPGARNEALLNAGVTSLSRETSPGFSGFGRVVGKEETWGVVRMSQEHGILGWIGEREAKNIEEEFSVGERAMVWCNHVCITAAAFFVYFVVDGDDIVRETWMPWKGW
ncbi:uncharacterized protein J7T54_003716 [Emericellopsis cladophorae]|uniref:D-serine dehydratase n=1 Tax=Emericellopsis cladophorae TaxID=2686198 RepID=A0A9P9XYD3_9HYPO|nr:uncharacterized protein J7T54_003716 [Emericellopsis cladophorae]KAI6779793.1 hypothetical protein J7T54_003716 [Emericellopsis cladophorae]